MKLIVLQMYLLLFLQTEFPDIVENPQNSSVPAGGVARFNCSATGFPLPEILWMKDGIAISQLSDTRFSTERTTFMDELLSVSVLSLDRPDLSDNGLYSCNASNELRLFNVTTSESAELFVLCKEICTHGTYITLKSMHEVCKYSVMVISKTLYIFSGKNLCILTLSLMEFLLMVEHKRFILDTSFFYKIWHVKKILLCHLS